jgi:hypothetical protein
MDRKTTSREKNKHQFNGHITLKNDLPESNLNGCAPDFRIIRFCAEFSAGVASISIAI